MSVVLAQDSSGVVYGFTGSWPACVYVLTAYRGLLVLLKVVVDEAHDERGLDPVSVYAVVLCSPVGKVYFSDSRFSQQHELDAAAGFRLRGCVRHRDDTGCSGRGRDRMNEGMGDVQVFIEILLSCTMGSVVVLSEECSRLRRRRQMLSANRLEQ